MGTATGDNAFREVLYALYLAWSERRGVRAVLRFELEGNLKPSTVAKVFAQQHDTLDLATIDRLLDGLSDSRFGVVTAAEREQWAEELHVARLVEMEKNHFVKLVNPEIGTLPDDYMDALWAWARERYRRFKEQGLWAIEGTALALLARRMWGEEAAFEETFQDNRHKWRYHSLRPAASPEVRDGRLRLRRGIVVPFGVPALRDFVVSATFEGPALADDDAAGRIVGLTIFDLASSFEYETPERLRARVPWPKAQEIIHVHPSTQYYLAEHRGHDEVRWDGYEPRDRILALGTWTPHISPRGRNRLAIRREGRSTSLFINDVEIENLYHDLPEDCMVGIVFSDDIAGPFAELVVSGFSLIKLPRQPQEA